MSIRTLVTFSKLFLIVSMAVSLRPSGALGQSGPPDELGGPVELYRWPESATNLLVNPSFEQMDADGAPIGWRLGKPEHWSLVTTSPFDGQRSLRLLDSHLSSGTPSATQSLSLEPGWYSLRGALRATKAGTIVGGSGGRIAIWTGTGADATATLSGTSGWKTLARSNVHVEPGDSPSLRLEAYRKPDGEIGFDGLALHRRTPPLVEGFLRYPNYRGVLFDDRSQIVRVSVRVHPEASGRSLSAIYVRAAIADETGAARLQQGLIPSQAAFELQLDASGLPLGRYHLRLTALDAANGAPLFDYPPYAIVKLPASARNTMNAYIDTDNTLVLHGQRRFALGIYDTSGRSNDPSYYEPRIAKIAEAPLNLYLNYWLGGATASEIGALTTTLGAHGLSYLHTVNNWYESSSHWPYAATCGGRTASQLGETAFTQCQASALSQLDGVAGWYTADERDVDYAAPTFGQYRLLREAKGDGVTFIAQNRPSELERWRDVTDVIGVDGYPVYNVPEGTLSPLEDVTSWVEQARRASENSRPVWSVIQYFQHGSKGHFPTYGELRSMSYMAIVAGARGLFFWSNGAKGLEWVSDPDLKEAYWQRLVRLTEELAGLEPVLLAPARPDLVTASADARIRFLAKEVDGARYIFAVNNSQDADVPMTLTLSQDVGTAEVLSEGRTIAGKGAVLEDVFAPHAVHIYRMSANVAPPTEALVNGSFEAPLQNGTIPGWPITGETSSVISGHSRTGTKSLLDYSPQRGYGYVASSVWLEPGTYALRGYAFGAPLKATSPPPVVIVYVTDETGTLVDYAVTDVNMTRWSALSGTLAIVDPGNYWVLALTIHYDGGFTVIDDLSLSR